MQNRLCKGGILGLISSYLVLICVVTVSANPFIAETVTITVGVDEDAAPMEFADNGEPNGFNVNLMQAIAADRGYSVEYRFMAWPNVLESVKNGSLDVMFAIDTEEREVDYDFTTPILEISWRIFVQEDTLGISNLEDLENRTVVVVENFAAHQYLNQSEIAVHLVIVKTTPEALELLSNGDVFAYFGNYHTALYYLQDLRINNLKSIGDPVDQKNMALAVKKGSSLLESLNLGLENIHANGQYDQIYGKWYGTSIGQNIFEDRYVKIGIGVILGLIAGVFLLMGWNYTLNKRVHKQTQDLRKSQEILMRQDKMESLGILAGGIAHDFNNFLTSILGNISIAKMELETLNIPQSELSSILEDAEEASKRAKGLTQQLLSFSKGGITEKQELNLGNLIKQSVLFAARGSKIKPQISISSDLSPILGDKNQLHQVIQNLVINGLHAMPSGGDLHVNVSNLDLAEVNSRSHPNLDVTTSKSFVEIEITDTGIGIAPENLSKIFDPYFSTKESGNGLGLTVCYRIIKNHEGEIYVSSKLGQGTTFRIILPALRDVSQPKRISPIKLIKSSGTVLIMDDQQGIREVLTHMLRKMGFTPRVSENGHEFLTLVKELKNKEQSVRFALLDITIPGGMGGMETFDNLKEIDPSIPVVVMSGYSNNPVMNHFDDYQFADVLPKPFTFEELAQKVNRILS